MTDETVYQEDEDATMLTEWNTAPKLIKGLSLIVAILMFAMIMLIFVDVIGRYAFSKPIPGGFEMVEFVMASLIFSAIPLVSYYNSHITVGLFDGAFKGRVRRVQQSFVLLFTVLMLGFMAERLFDQAQYMWATELYGLQLDVPVAPIVLITAFMSGVACLLVVLLTIRYWRTGIEPASSGTLD